MHQGQSRHRQSESAILKGGDDCLIDRVEVASFCLQCDKATKVTASTCTSTTNIAAHERLIIQTWVP